MRKESLGIRFLYRTVPGRLLLKVMVQRPVSFLGGAYMNSFLSKVLIPRFIRKNQIDMEPFQGQKYTSFNDFFIRKNPKLKIEESNDYLISPCDGKVSAYKIDHTQRYHIKNVDYNLEDLLKNKELAEEFRHGICLIFRLTPRDYHRYVYACSARVEEEAFIKGILHTVRPIAYTSRPVFAQNSRAYSVLTTEDHGKVIQMEVGAMMIGRITNHKVKGSVIQGEEKGYFEFGGSTIILFLQEGQVDIPEIWFKRTSLLIETAVSIGEKIGPYVTA